MQALRRLREEAGMTQFELAKEAGLSLTGVNYIEAGRRRPQLETTRKLAKALAKRLGRDWREVLAELAQGTEAAPAS